MKYELDNDLKSDHAQNMGGATIHSKRRHLWAWRSYTIILVTPLLLALLPAIVGTSESRCAYVVLVMAILWFTEAIPVGVTALLPMVLFPTLGILSVAETSKSYMKDTIMLFLGGLIVAITIEYWNLHRRIALRILLLVGSEPRWLMLGLMVATWFLSMWISNTATTAMMLPITEAVLQQIHGTRSKFQKESKEGDRQSHTNSKPTDNTGVEMKTFTEKDSTAVYTINGSGDTSKTIKDTNSTNSSSTSNPTSETEDFDRLAKGMSLCICYAASCGGIGSLTGTGPNLVLKDNSDDMYKDSKLSNPVTFGSWMAFGVPMSIVVLIVCYIWLQVAFLGRNGIWCCFKREGQDEETKGRVRQVIKDEYKKLGPIVFGQGLVLALFVLLVILWVTRDMGGTLGWGHMFDLEIKDSVPAILVGILCFMLPSTIPCIGSYSNYSHPEKDGSLNQDSNIIIRPLINWEFVNKKMPWSLIFLLGGGFALSSGFNKSGLSDWIGNQLNFVRDWNEWATLLMVCYIAAACTEITSNTAMSSVMLPIMQKLARNVGVHPLSFMFPVCLSTSFAFMLPVATPPNAIVFAYGRVTIPEMAKTGIVLNILAVPCVVFMTQTLGPSVFGFNDSPFDFPLNGTEALPVVSA